MKRKVVPFLGTCKPFLGNSFQTMKTPPEQTIGQRIAQARRRRGVELRRDLLQSDVAEALGVGPATVSRWEADQAVPRDDALGKLAAFLGVTAPYLRYGVQQQPGDFREGHGEIVAGRGAPAKKVVPKKQA